MTQNLVLPALMIALTPFFACNNSNSNDSKHVADHKNEQKIDSGTLNKKMDDDAEFLTEASSGVRMEVELGNYALQNAGSPRVKAFGQRMVKDHGKDVEEIKSLAAKKNIAIPTVPGDKFQKHINDLEQKKGADFDKAYMSFMVSDHKDDISEFEKEAKDGRDPDVAAFAKKGIPILKEHLSMAKSTNDSVK